MLVRDVLVWIDTKRWAPIALGQLWFDLNRSSLNLVQAVVQRYIHPFLWDPIIVTILLCWAFAVLMVLGLVILRISGRRARRRTQPQPSPILRAAMKADCGISTLPNWRIRFLPSFCFSRSLRLRVTSPP